MKVAPAPSSEAASSSGHDGWVDVPAIEIDDDVDTGKVEPMLLVLGHSAMPGPGKPLLRIPAGKTVLAAQPAGEYLDSTKVRELFTSFQRCIVPKDMYDLQNNDSTPNFRYQFKVH